MNNSNNEYQKEKITANYIPLAIYREIAAHLKQIEGVEINFIPQTSPTFDYNYSQINGFELSYPVNLNSYEKQSLNNILNYYSEKTQSFSREFIN
jgi:hypothetical protein